MTDTSPAFAWAQQSKHMGQLARRRGQQRMKRGVSYAVNLVLGLAEEIEEK